jgi:hypothetical protein
MSATTNEGCEQNFRRWKVSGQMGGWMVNDFNRSEKAAGFLFQRKKEGDQSTAASSISEKQRNSKQQGVGVEKVSFLHGGEKIGSLL